MCCSTLFQYLIDSNENKNNFLDGCCLQQNRRINCLGRDGETVIVGGQFKKIIPYQT